MINFNKFQESLLACQGVGDPKIVRDIQKQYTTETFALHCMNGAAENEQKSSHNNGVFQAMDVGSHVRLLGKTWCLRLNFTPPPLSFLPGSDSFEFWCDLWVDHAFEVLLDGYLYRQILHYAPNAKIVEFILPRSDTHCTCFFSENQTYHNPIFEYRGPWGPRAEATMVDWKVVDAMIERKVAEIEQNPFRVYGTDSSDIGIRTRALLRQAISTQARILEIRERWV